MGYVSFSMCPHRTDDLMPLRASVPTDYVFRTPRIDRCIYTYFQAIYVYIHIHRIYIYMCMSQLWWCRACLEHFGWIQSKLRNKMLPATAKKLVMVHMWLRIETMKDRVGQVGGGLATTYR